jgi:glycosyltransferase involved in cell wall biosynthesis
MTVSVIMTTYNRTAIAAKTLQSLVDHLLYPDLRWIIADDGSDEGHLETLLDIVPNAQVTQANRGGVGKSKNLALTLAFETSPYVLLTEDDWYLPEPLDLESHVQIMQDHPDVGMIRFGFLGAMPQENFTAIYRDYGNFQAYWDLQPATAMYIYSGQISLRSEAFYKMLGMHLEGAQAGIEEEELCRRYNAFYVTNELLRSMQTVETLLNTFGTTRDVKGSFDTAYSILKDHYQPKPELKILWPAQYGCTLNAGVFKNIGMGQSLNTAEPTHV